MEVTASSEDDAVSGEEKTKLGEEGYYYIAPGGDGGNLSSTDTTTTTSVLLSPTPSGHLTLPEPLLDGDAQSEKGESAGDRGEEAVARTTGAEEEAAQPAGGDSQAWSASRRTRSRLRSRSGATKPSPPVERLIECIRKGILVMVTHAEHEPVAASSADDVTPSRSIAVSFPPEGGHPPSSSSLSPLYTTPPHSLHSTFQFKEYSPHGFRRLRERSGISQVVGRANEKASSIILKNINYTVGKSSVPPGVCVSVMGTQADYLLAMTNYEDCYVFNANSNSGGTFFFTSNKRYLVKTHSKSESKFLRKILKDYLEYMDANHDTLLVKIVGLYRLRMSPTQPAVHFVVMTNVLATDRPVWMTYDLKGSTVGRRTTGGGKGGGGQLLPTYYKGEVRKDQDLIDDKVSIMLGERKKALCLQLRRDAEFLCSKNIMDYSLLVAIIREPQQQHLPPDYVLGIIDILQEYTLKKRAAHLVKSLVHEARQISTVEPSLYASRFCAFIDSITTEERRSRNRSVTGGGLQEDCPISI